MFVNYELYNVQQIFLHVWEHFKIKEYISDNNNLLKNISINLCIFNILYFSDINITILFDITKVILRYVINLLLT